MKNSYDVIIIGAGSIGVPTALSIARNKQKVLVIDKLPSQGQGSNKAAIGGVRATHSDPSKLAICKRSLEVISNWEETFGHNIEWHAGGYCFVAYRKEEEDILKQLLVEQKKNNLEINWLDKNNLLKIVPDLNPENLIGGTFSPKDGHCSTLLAGHAFYDQAKKEGAEFRFNESVVEIINDKKTVSGVKTDKGEYSCNIVINAAGAWAKEIGNLVDLDLPIMADCHEAGITEPVKHFLGPIIVDTKPDDMSGNCYFYQLKSGQVIFCYTPKPNIWGFDTEATSSFLPLAAKRMLNLMPGLASIRVRRTWRGLYPMTPDGSPFIGWHPTLRGYLMAVGMCGQGFMLGIGVGELLARMILVKELSKIDNDILESLHPFREFKGQELLK